MTLKKRIIISVVGLILSMVIGFATLYIISGGSAAKGEKLAGLIGLIFGLMTVVGLAGLWLPYAAQVGKQRRAEMERKKKKKRKRRQ